MTGELELATRSRARAVEVAVRYAVADEWYTVERSPIKPGEAGDWSAYDIHEGVVRHLTTPGEIVDGNEEAVSLLSFSPSVGGS